LSDESCHTNQGKLKTDLNALIPGTLDCFSEAQIDAALIQAECFRLKNSRCSDLSVALAAAHILHMNPLQDAIGASAISAADKGKTFVHHSTTTKTIDIFWMQSVYGLQYLVLKRKTAISAVASMSSF
jgi:hypothetical protein